MFSQLRLILTTVLLFLMMSTQAADLKQIEQKLSDSVITTKITAKYTKNNQLNPLKIQVSTQDGIVKLRGHVRDQDAFSQALRLAVSTKGVLSVNTDNLEIKPINTIFTDAYITAKVEAAILKAKIFEDESIPLVGINASTTNGTVTLSGALPHSDSIAIVLKYVNAVSGVKQIISNLQVHYES